MLYLDAISSTTCAPYYVQINNLVPSNGNPNFSYFWDFGNGTTSTLENPDSVLYTLADTGKVGITQQVIIDTFPYLLDQVIVTATDCNDDIVVAGITITTGAPVMYMIVKDGTTELINTDPNTQPIIGTERNKYAPDTLLFPGPLTLASTPSQLEVWDDNTLGGDDQCGGAVTISANDGAGVHTKTSGGLTVEYNISHYVDTISFTDTVIVENCNTSVAYLNLVERTLTVYPSPTNDNVNIQFAMEGWVNDVDLMISDVLGRTVYTETIKNFDGQYNRQLDLSKNPDGIYLLQLKLGQKTIHRKIVLQK